LVDSIEGGDTYDMLSRFKEKHTAMEIPDSVFEAVHDGMQGVMESGTGRGSKVEGINICGKTGTVENYYRGVKQPNHSFFAAFAPREDPKIAIMCVVENSGRFGGTYAAPIATMMIEKYLHDTISTQHKARAEAISKTNLIPKLMLDKMREKDSIRKVREEEKALKNELRNIRDTLQSEDNPSETEVKNNKKGKDKPSKDSNNKPPAKRDMILPDTNKQRTQPVKDTGKKA
ncbi:MAG TPA: penicillin-binding transpeptidase domain-containing protein, partial [Chitinophagaceae bacterium]|nr:penicillin-binding transpeptidase domain-containing protein [Chitinophagaceae bacterium]